MGKYLVETYYTCSFKVSHYLDGIDEKNIRKLNLLNIFGYAGISYFQKKTAP